MTLRIFSVLAEAEAPLGLIYRESVTLQVKLSLIEIVLHGPHEDRLSLLLAFLLHDEFSLVFQELEY